MHTVFWLENLPLDAVVSYFVSQSSEFYRHNPLCCFLTSVYCCKHIFSYGLKSGNFWIHVNMFETRSLLHLFSLCSSEAVD